MGAGSEGKCVLMGFRWRTCLNVCKRQLKLDCLYYMRARRSFTSPTTYITWQKKCPLRPSQDNQVIWWPITQLRDHSLLVDQHYFCFTSKANSMSMLYSSPLVKWMWLCVWVSSDWIGPRRRSNFTTWAPQHEVNNRINTAKDWCALCQFNKPERHCIAVSRILLLN